MRKRNSAGLERTEQRSGGRSKAGQCRPMALTRSSRRVRSVLSSSPRKGVTPSTSCLTNPVCVSDPAAGSGHPAAVCPDPAPGPVLRRPPAKRQLETDQSDRQHGNGRSKRQKGDITSPESAKGSEAISPVRPRGSRHDVSLGLLTKKFFQMIDRSADGVVDLNQAAETLEIKKRRLYDITNVLTGIHLVKKKLKNKVQWVAPGACGILSRCHTLRQELALLVQEEAKLDQLIQGSNLSIRQMAEDTNLQRLAYVTSEDIRQIGSLRDQTVLVVKAPFETKLELPSEQESFQIHLTSTKGPINVFLCPDENMPGGLLESVVHVNGNVPVPEESDHSTCRQTQGGPGVLPASSEGPFVVLSAPSTTQYLPALEDDEGINYLLNFERGLVDSHL